MDVKIGVKGAPREIVLETSAAPEDVEAAVRAAVADGGVLSLVDDKGRQVLVPVAMLAYVDIGETERGKVGFTALV